MAGDEIRACPLFTAQMAGQSLGEAIKAFFDVAENEGGAFAIFYAPHACSLAKFKDGSFMVPSGKESLPAQLSEKDLKKVFEARIFNSALEMRWLNDPDGNHSTAILSEKQLTFGGKPLQVANVLGGLPQTYLFWGQSTGERHGSDWTEFATARLGAFHVPVPDVPQHGYARITAVEYLKEYRDGNVAVFDERLTGLESYKGESSDA